MLCIWLCVPIVDQPSLLPLPSVKVHALYGVLFHWIGHEPLRPLLCNLLYRMTRPEDVLVRRVHRLYPSFPHLNVTLRSIGGCLLDS